jgi:hypothetical protein
MYDGVDYDDVVDLLTERNDAVRIGYDDAVTNPSGRFRRPGHRSRIELLPCMDEIEGHRGRRGLEVPADGTDHGVAQAEAESKTLMTARDQLFVLRVLTRCLLAAQQEMFLMHDFLLGKV